MKCHLIITAFILFQCTSSYAQNNQEDDNAAGTVSIGTRNSFSLFNDDPGTGIGIGGQTRVQVSDHVNTEWFLDYISSKNKTITTRNDYHIGWSVMYYPGSVVDFSNLLQPYIIAGHCFDYSKVSEQKNKSNYVDRWTMATQAGLGTHINISRQLDCSLAAQYMLHFGKDIETITDKEIVYFEKKNFSTANGHLLVSLSFNYKLFHLW